MASTIKVDNVQNQPGTNIVSKCGTTTTIGAGAGETIKACAATVTLGRCGGTVALASGATQTGFGASGAVSWITTPKVTGDSPVTGVTGNGYFMNTTAGAITLNLPAGTAGDIVAVADYAATFATNVLSIAPNGSEKIGGLSGTVQLGINGQAATFVYVDSTQGWVNTMDSTSDIRASTYIVASGGAETTCGDYKIHVFTSPGTFTVSSQGTPTNDEAQYLVVAGGGSGAAANYSNIGEGGGGAGGFRVYDGCSPSTPPLNAPAALTITAGSYPIAVGGGAAVNFFPGASTGVIGIQGSPSVFASIASAGGGFGALCGCVTPPASAGAGGSGGGGGRGNANFTCGGAGNTPPVSPPQGQNGGGGTPLGARAAPAPSPNRNGGGGGGAGGGGGTGDDYGAKFGGIGSYVCGPNFIGPSGGIYGESGPVSAGRYFAGGGGGAGQLVHPEGQAGGIGGGTAGNNSNVASDATANTGGGGGAASGVPFPTNASGAGRGGSGIVIIKYKYQ